MNDDPRAGSGTIRSPFYQNLRKCCSDLEQRFVMTFLVSLGIMSNYMQRVCFYITIVDMTKRITKDKEVFRWYQESSWKRCPHIFILDDNAEGEFRDWSDSTQGLLLASFSIGHFFTSVFGGYIADKYGAKHIFAASLLATSVCSIITPYAADSGPTVVMVVRFLMGLAQGPMFPAGAAILSRWSPSHERPLHCAIANSGVPLGSFLSNLLSGTVCSASSWRWVFYIYGFIGIGCFVVWEVFIFSAPDTHRYISAAERTYIEYNIHHTSPKTHGKIPWKAIFTSKRFLVIAWANFGFDWGFYIVSLELPFYLYYVLHFPIMKIGAVSSMPWMSMWIGALIYGLVSQFLISEGIIRKIDMRKTMAIMSNIVPAVLLILASWAACSHVLVCLLFSVSMFYAGAGYSGLRLSVLDLAPNFAGLLMSLVNAFSSLAGVAVPIIVHNMIDDGGTILQWRLSFWISTVLMGATSVPYLLFATTSIQDWNKGLDPQQVEIFPRPTLSPMPSRTSEDPESSRGSNLKPQEVQKD